ncbi:MAG: UDP-N-acetylmuramoyl-L-alanine--D-glutamate ligase [Candidatus Binataceae bacterium]
MMKLAGKTVMVVGLATTGIAAAKFLAAHGAHLILTDRRSDIDRAELPPAQLKLGAENPGWLDGVDLVVATPGAALDSPLLAAAAKRKIELIGEVELASRFLSAPIAAITGTNGKSTVTVLLGAILKAAGMHPFVGGNLQPPLITAVDGVYDAIVAEVSSFQLESTVHFKPKVGVYLNLTDDHFDRYRDLAEYGVAKARMFENQDGSDWAVLNRDDPNVWELAKSVRSRVFAFGFVASGHVPGIWHENRSLIFDMGSRRGQISIAGFRLPGEHNVSNAMAATAAALAMYVDEHVIEHVLSRFAGLPHRLEFVLERDGVRWIDDSKGTNVGAVVEAIGAITAPIILIAGGVDKGGDYGPLVAPMRRKVSRAILIGAAREQMRSALTGACEIELVTTLAEAVERAARVARKGDTVLLSPACSSFDQFKNYAERGELFQKLVRTL